VIVWANRRLSRRGTSHLTQPSQALPRPTLFGGTCLCPFSKPSPRISITAIPGAPHISTCTSHQHMHLPPAHAPPTGTRASVTYHIFPSPSHITITRSPTIKSRTIQPHVHRPSKASKALYHLRPYPPTLRGCADPVSKPVTG